MNKGLLPTHFAPAERVDKEAIRRQTEAFLGMHCSKLMDAVSTILLVLNGQRQAIFGNRSCLEFLGVPLEDLLGQRPGELFGCVHSMESEGGCGTTEFCANCGAVQAILTGLAGARDLRQCRMLRHVGNRIQALDLAVSTDPYLVDGEQFLVVSIVDVSHEVRRRALEHIFFHDVLNVAGGLRGISELLRAEVPENLRREADVLFSSLNYLVDEILSQKELMAAENNELTPRIGEMRSVDFLRALLESYSSIPVARGIGLTLDPDSEELILRSDPVLLRRVVGNMLKNAIEASRQGQAVRLGCRREDGEAVLWVHNQGCIPRKAQLQIFNRSFSTKGQGRGLGTYSILLLTERYLKGRVHFESSPEKGTLFWVALPLD